MELTFASFLFYLIAALTVLCAFMVLITQNIVRSAAWLLFCLAGVSGIFFFLNADFVGATQLLVYVGGTLVLVVFGVMLTAQGPFISMKTGAGEWAIAAVVGCLLFGVLAVSTTSATWSFAKAKETEEQPDVSRSSVVLGQGFLGMGVGPSYTDYGKPENKQASAISYLLPFEIVSVHLLVVLIGAAYLARAKRRRSAET
jgi:NADH-quinone oxidoreductase subunit J